MRGVRDERPLRQLPRPGLRDDRRSHGGRSPLYPHARQVRGVPSPRPQPPCRRLRTIGDRVRRRRSGNARVGRCCRRAHEEGSCVRPRNGGQGRRGLLPQERPRPRDRRRARADPRADANAEILRLGWLAEARKEISRAQAGYRKGFVAASAASLARSSIHCWNSSALWTVTKPRIRAWPIPQSWAQAISYWNSGFPVWARMSSVVTVGMNQIGMVNPGTASCFTRNSGTPKLWMTSLLRSLTIIGLFTGR